MDTATPVTHVSLCAGYGGIDLGLKRVVPALRTVAFSEIEAFAVANLVAKMEAGHLDAAPVWTNLKTFPWAEFHGCVDILSGGYPCQPFSAAGKRLGTEDPRHLWPFIAGGIRLMRPVVCFFENVEGHISLGLDAVIAELESLGYRATWGIFSAAEVGAPHQRKRIFILAVADDQRDRVEELGGWITGESEQRALGHAGGNVWPARPGGPQHGWEPPRVLGDAEGRGLGERGDAPLTRDGGYAYSANATVAHAGRTGSDGRTADTHEQPGERPSGDVGGAGAAMADADGTGPRQDGGHCGQLGFHSPCRDDRGDAREAERGEDRHGEAEPPLGRDIDGPADRLDASELHNSTDNRTDELRLLGNGVVPACAALAFRTLWGEMMTL